MSFQLYADFPPFRSRNAVPFCPLSFLHAPRSFLPPRPWAEQPRRAAGPRGHRSLLERRCSLVGDQRLCGLLPRAPACPFFPFLLFLVFFFFFFAGVGCVGVSVPRRGQSLLSVLPSQAMLVLKRQPAAERSHEHTDTYDPLPAIVCSAGEAKSSFRRVQRFSLVHSSNVLLPYLCTRGRRMVPPSFLAPRALFPCSQRLHPLLAPITSRTRSLTASQLDFCSIQTAFGPQQPPTAPTTYLVFDISGLK